MHKNALLTIILVKRLDMPSCALYMSYITHVDLHLCLFEDIQLYLIWISSTLGRPYLKVYHAFNCRAGC